MITEQEGYHLEHKHQPLIFNPYQGGKGNEKEYYEAHNGRHIAVHLFSVEQPAAASFSNEQADNDELTAYAEECKK